MVSLSKFYAERQNIDKITPIIQGKSDISLRLLDWFVTNYSKKTSTTIAPSPTPMQTTVKDSILPSSLPNFNVYLSYRSQLKAYSKQQFDPFRRRDRITFYYDHETSIETTIGQLNFFRWVIQNNILNYIHENMQAIEQDMFSVQKKNVSPDIVDPTTGSANASTDRSHKTDEKGGKRIELSKSFVKNMNRFEGTRLINFN